MMSVLKVLQLANCEIIRFISVDLLELVELFLKVRMQKYRKYLGIKHDYHNTNCITLIADIYKNELPNEDTFKKIWDYLDITEGHPEQEDKWWKFFDLKRWNKFLKEYCKKIENLTEIQEYDVIVFSTSRRRIPIHFGMYIGQNYMIHLEEKGTSKIEMLTDTWRGKIHSVYRRKMV